MPLGALINPSGRSSDVLSETEHDMLNTCLELYRSKDKHLYAVAETIGYLKEPKYRTFSLFLHFLRDNLGECVEDVRGLLDGVGESTVLLEGDEGEEQYKTLIATLHVLRAGGWFAKFLSLQVRTIADGNPLPSPLLLAQSLTDDIEEFEKELAIARRVYEQHPGLIDPNISEGSPEKMARLIDEVLNRYAKGDEALSHEALQRPGLDMLDIADQMG